MKAATGRLTKDMLSLAYLAGFPPGDLRECGPTVSAHAYSKEEADAAADEIAQLIALKEAEFAEPLLTPDEAVKEAMRIATSASKPVVIADTQDNPGCGGTADTVGMLEALVQNKAQNAIFGVVKDSDVAAMAHQAGVGAEIETNLGGQADLPNVTPYHGRFKVEVINNGVYQTTGPVAQGKMHNVGAAALLSIGGVKVAVASERVQAHDRSVFEHFGIVLQNLDIIVVKSTAHYRAHFDPIAETTFAAIAPGGHGANPVDFPYTKLRDGVRYYPLGPVRGG